MERSASSDLPPKFDFNSIKIIMSNEIILETVRELLPDIEHEIREQVA